MLEIKKKEKKKAEPPIIFNKKEFFSKEEIRDLTISIIDHFEDLLEEQNITIPDECREGDESEARIFGTNYYNLEDKIINTINNFLDMIERNANSSKKEYINPNIIIPDKIRKYKEN